MKIHYLRIGILLILAILALFSSAAPSVTGEIYSRDRARKLRLVYGLSVSNKGRQTVKDITVRIPVIQSRLPYQTATVTKIVPPADTREASANGVDTARFSLSSIAPGEKKTFLIYAEAEICEVTYRLEGKKVLNPDASMKKYLSMDSEFSTDSPALKSRCIEFEKEASPLGRAMKIYDYIISGSFTFSNSAAGNGVDKAFERKHLNCSDAAALYLVMCRRCRIPARYICGIFYNSERKWYPLLHSWVEINIPPFGWLPVDPTLGRLSEKNRRLCFAHIRNRYIALWSDQQSAFSIEGSSGLDGIEVRNSVFAESR
jgi:transglutaminase-like putative cysteine protease